MKKFFLAAALMVAAFSAHSAYTINIVAVGGDVVMTGNGSFDLTGSTINGAAGGCTNGFISTTMVCVGQGNVGLAGVNVLTPAVSGVTSGSSTSASTAIGPMVIVTGSNLFLPAGYVSGSAVSSQSVFTGRTLASMGLTGGTVKTLALPSGDTIVIRVGPAPVAAVTSIPTLSEYGQMALASLMAMVGFVAVKRKRQV